MPAQQLNALERNPNNLPVTLVATYERTIGASIERVWENVLDWEHLPHLHATSFNYCTLDEAGDWGWRTWSNPEQTDHVELCLKDETQYVARSYRGGEQISEIWTTLTGKADKTDIRVEFFIPNIPADKKAPLGDAMLSLYTQLWNEDEEMMIERQRRLDENRSEVGEVEIGDVDAVSARLAAGEAVHFQLRRREFALIESGDGFRAVSTICPHLLGPLNEHDAAAGTVRCPWHGYTFDIETGECVSPADATCRLTPAPEVEVNAGKLIATAR